MRVLITGASSGIGLELAKLYSKKGHELILTGRNKDALKELQKELNTKSTIIIADLSKKEGMEKIKESCKNIDCLINNAGLGDYNTFKRADPDKLQAMIDVNITALTQLSREAIPHMKKRKHQTYIINIASVAGFLPGPKMATYFATKHYVLALSEALSEELSNTNISVTAICPGPVDTKFSKTAKITNDDSFKNGATPEEIAQFTYKSMINKKRIAVYGLQHKILIQILKFLPRKTITKLVGKMQ